MTDDLAAPEQIAIVGMAGRFPGAATWTRSGPTSATGSSRSARSPTRSSGAGGADPSRAGLRERGGGLDGIDQFDAAFFGMSRREAELTDPSTASSSRCAWAALEHAGYDPAAYPGRVGVFGGVGPQHVLPQQRPAAPRTCWPGPGTTRCCWRRSASTPSRASPTSWTSRGRRSACRPPARRRWSPSTWPARACSPASATWRSPAACSHPGPGDRGYLYQEDGILSPGRPLPRLRRRRARARSSAAAPAVVVLKRLGGRAARRRHASTR